MKNRGDDPGLVEVPRSSVLVVGSSSLGRRRVTAALIGKGYATMICDGAPGCALLAHERCPLVEAADATVIMPTSFPARDVTSSLAACARESCNPIVVEPSIVRQLPLGARVASSAHPTILTKVVDATLDDRRARSV